MISLQIILLYFHIFVLLYFIAEGNSKVGHRTTSTVIQQEDNATLAIDALNSDAFLKTMILNPPVDNSPADNPLPPLSVDAFDLVPPQNNTQHEETQEPLRYSSTYFNIYHHLSHILIPK